MYDRLYTLELNVERFSSTSVDKVWWLDIISTNPPSDVSTVHYFELVWMNGELDSIGLTVIFSTNNGDNEK